jgi:hypothetical protein
VRVFSENTPNSGKELHSVILRVVLTGVKYVDDKTNPFAKSQSPEVCYSGVVLGGVAEGRVLNNIRDAAATGGSEGNYGERVYTITKAPISGKNKLPINKQDASIVYVGFLDGDINYPIIIGKAKGALDKAYTGAKKLDGPRLRWQYNGIFFEINKNGELTLKNKGGSFLNAENKFQPTEDGNKATFQLKNNSFTATFEGGVSLSFDGATKQVSLKANTTELLIDGNTGKISLKGENIDIGKTVVDMATKFSALAAAYNTHTHPYTDNGSPLMTSPPVVPLSSAVATQKIKVSS